MQFIGSVLRARRQRHERFVQPRIAATTAGRDLRPVADRTSVIRNSDILAFVPLAGPAPLLAGFLAHHRRRGVGHFLFADLAADDASRAVLLDAGDCSIWHAADATGEARHALNHLRARFGQGRWCLSLTPDSLLVYPFCETRSLPDLVEFLGSEGRETLYAIHLDMYAPSAASASAASTADPLAVSALFDATGYVQRADVAYGDTSVQGGPLRRIASREDPSQAPRLDAIPLVRWRKDYHYLEANRLLAPKRLNRPHARWHLSPTACLLRFGHPAVSTGGNAVFDQSVAYRDTAQLVELGLMCRGQWF